jgi:hypothetical protein
VGQIDTGVGILESSVFLPNDLADIFNGESVWEWGWVRCRRGGFTQSYSDRC